MQSFYRLPFDSADIEAAITFIQEHPYPPLWSGDLVRRFLTNMTSSSDCIFDFYRAGQRIALGVLVDKIQNKGNHATLEILGLRYPHEREPVLMAALADAKKCLDPTRSGIEITFDASFPINETFATSVGLEPYYDVDTMIHDRLHTVPSAIKWDVIPATQGDNPALYDVLVDAFRDNLDTSIAPYEEWSKVHRDGMWLIKNNGAIVGFSHCLISDGTGEIRSIGVIPSMRGQGIAFDLMTHALHDLCRKGISQCHLSVAATNQQALRLYRQLGFRKTEQYSVYKWKKN